MSKQTSVCGPKSLFLFHPNRRRAKERWRARERTRERKIFGHEKEREREIKRFGHEKERESERSK